MESRRKMRKNMFQRIIASFMACMLLIGTVTMPVNAYDTSAVSAGANMSADYTQAGDIVEPLQSEWSIKGTNSFGNLLLDEIIQENASLQENSGYNIFSVEMDGQSANVTFETAEDAELVVAIYDETGVKLLVTADKDVKAGDMQATVMVETEDMPKYFYLRGFLIEPETMRPLCAAYESPMYTEEMQQFLKKSTADFETEKVLNLDENEKDNFAVYSDDTILIPQEDGVNEVKQADDEKQVYVIENADETILSLMPGDIFSYPYEDGELLIVKVANITVDGTTATITGAEASMEEVFDYVKIDTDAGAKDADIDASGLEDGVTYEGVIEIDTSEPKEENRDASEDIEVESDMHGALVDKEDSMSTALSINLFKNKDEDISGTLDFSLKSSIKVYISWNYQYLEIIPLEYSMKLSIELSEKLPLKEIALPGITVSPIAGVYIEVTPKFVVEASAKMSLSGTLYGTVGFSVSSDDGFKNLSTTPKFKTEMKGELSVFIGIAIEPKICIISEKIASAKVKATVGAEIKAEQVIKKPSESVVHTCGNCWAGEINGKAEAKFEASILKLKRLTFKKSWSKTVKLFDFYYSVDYGEFAFTKCPHCMYLITVNLTDGDKSNGHGVENARVTAPFYVNHNERTEAEIKRDDLVQTDMITTDENGKAHGYLPAGTYTLELSADGYKPAQKKITITDAGKEVLVRMEYGGKKARELYCLGDRSAAIAEDGSLYTWGSNYRGRLGNGTTEDSLTPVKILDNVVSYYGNAAITGDGSLYMWGENKYGQVGNGTTQDCLEPVKVLDNVAEFQDINHGASAAVTKDGSLYTWGSNDYWGILGNGTTENSLVPVKILDHVAYMSWEYNFAGAVTKDGSLYMWGSNFDGQLGNGTTQNTLEPVKVMDRVVSISSSDWSNVCAAVTENGSLYMWGNNRYGQLGNGTKINSNRPVKIMDNVRYVDAIGHYTVAITKNGDLYVWGQTSSGNTGININIEEVLNPTKVLGNVNNVLINASASSGSGAITQNGELYVWGYDTVGNPVKIPLNNVVSYNRGVAGEPIAITGEGGLYMWGSYTINEDEDLWFVSLNEEDVVDISDTMLAEGRYIVNSNKPVKMLDNVEPAGLMGGWSDTSVLTRDGDYYTWGFNWAGEVGDGTTVNSAVLKRVLKNVKTACSCEIESPGGRVEHYRGAITNDGSLYMWGANYNGQLGIGTKENSLVPARVFLPDDRVVAGLSGEDSRFSEIDIPKISYLKAETVSTEENSSVRKVNFTELIPEKIYNYYVMKEKTAEQPLANENLLFIGQSVSDVAGNMSVTLEPREEYEEAEIFAVSMEKKELSGADVTIPDMTYTGREQIVHPIVTFGDTELNEGVDYELTGGFRATDIESYTVLISGIGLYQGQIAANYKIVNEKKPSDDGTQTEPAETPGTEQTSAPETETTDTQEPNTGNPGASNPGTSGSQVQNSENPGKPGTQKPTQKPVKKPSVAKVKSFKIKPGKKKLAMSWKKLSGVAGYQLQVSTKKNFKGAKTISLSKSKKAYTKKGLKAKRKYYVRIRAYKTYRNAKGKTQKVYGKWVTGSKKTK